MFCGFGRWRYAHTIMIMTIMIMIIIIVRKIITINIITVIIVCFFIFEFISKKDKTYHIKHRSTIGIFQLMNSVRIRFVYRKKLLGFFSNLGVYRLPSRSLTIRPGKMIGLEDDFPIGFR